MRVAIHQPNFLPRLKVLQKLSAADNWIVLDNVQFAQREWQNRARIVPVNPRQPSFWLTLPVRLASGQTTLIQDVQVVEAARVISRMSDSLRYAFRAAEYWTEVNDYWEEVKATIVSDDLVGIVLPTVTIALQRFGRIPRIQPASELDARGKSSALIAEICRRVGATEYLADSGARNYLRVTDFDYRPISWQEWKEPLPIETFPWRNVSFLNYLARRGAEALSAHLCAGSFIPDFNPEVLTGTEVP